MTAQPIAPVIPSRDRRAARACGRAAPVRRLPLAAAPESPSPPDEVVYGFGRIDVSGRVGDRAIVSVLGWQPGDRLTFTAAAGVVIARRDPGGLAQAGMIRAPWAITTVVSCLPVLVLGMGTTLAHLLRADAETTNAPGNGTGPPAALRSLPWSPDDRDRPDRARPRRTGTGPRAGTRTAGRREDNAAAAARDLVSGLPGRRWVRPALSPAGLPRRGSPYRGERCAAAESRARTRR